MPMAGENAFIRFLLKTSGTYLADNHLKVIFATHFTEQSGLRTDSQEIKAGFRLFHNALTR
jgi:hypothetical protein